MRPNARAALLRSMRNPPVRALSASLAAFLLSAGERLESTLRAAEDTTVPAARRGAPAAVRPVRVEFLGPSGVGKSTLARSVERRLGRDGRLVRRVLPRPPRTTVTFAPAPLEPQLERFYAELLRARAARLLSRTEPADAAARRLRFAARILLEDYRITAMSSDAVVLRHEGVLHNFGSTVAEVGQDREGLEAFLARRLIIVCRADSRTVAERALRRQAAGSPRSQYHGLSTADAEAVIRRAFAVVDATVATVRRTDIPVLEVDSSRPLAALGDEVASFIRERLDRTHP